MYSSVLLTLSSGCPGAYFVVVTANVACLRAEGEGDNVCCNDTLITTALAERCPYFPLQLATLCPPDVT
jgi:hypothetical protein